MNSTGVAALPARAGFGREFADFWRFVRRPTLGPRLPRAAMPALAADWLGAIDLWRIMRWVMFLWTVNLFLLGPLAAGVAWMTGAGHRFNAVNLPWLLALVWAPIVEEIMFRFGMRKPGTLIWLLPAFVVVVMNGSGWLPGLFLALSMALVALPGMPGVRWRFSWNRRYRRFFPLVFHAATMAFATLHLLNFTSLASSWWLLPLLVLPQWLTGLVLGWMRVRAGIGAAIIMHALFNSGPLVLIWVLVNVLGS